MDAQGLPLVGPGLDYAKVEAINQKRIVAFINHFLSHTVQFMNHFAVVCEEKLLDVNIRIQRLDASLSILETKLTFIKGLENVTVPGKETHQELVTPTESRMVATNGDAHQQRQDAVEVPSTEMPQPESTTTSEPELTVAKDPRFMRFFKQLQVGVPAMAVKQKMAIEGYDPDLLDTPNAPAPPPDPKKDSESENEEDW